MIRQELVWEFRKNYQDNYWYLMHRQFFKSSTSTQAVAYCESSRKTVSAWFDYEPTNRGITLTYLSVRAAKKDLYDICKELYLDD